MIVDYPLSGGRDVTIGGFRFGVRICFQMIVRFDFSIGNTQTQLAADGEPYSVKSTFNDCRGICRSLGS